MKIVHSGSDAIHIGNPRDIKQSYFDDDYWLNELGVAAHHMLRRRPIFRRAIDEYVSNSGLSGQVLLDSDGNSNGSNWMYMDEDNRRKVQDFIDEIDGRYSIAFLAICNQGNKGRVNSRRTVVVHTREVTSYLDIIRGHGIVTSVFIPGVGYLPDNSRKVRRIIESLSSLNAPSVSLK